MKKKGGKKTKKMKCKDRQKKTKRMCTYVVYSQSKTREIGYVIHREKVKRAKKIVDDGPYQYDVFRLFNKNRLLRWFVRTTFLLYENIHYTERIKKYALEPSAYSAMPEFFPKESSYLKFVQARNMDASKFNQFLVKRLLDMKPHYNRVDHGDFYHFQKVIRYRLYRFPPKDLKEFRREYLTRRYRWQKIVKDRFDRILKRGKYIEQVERLFSETFKFCDKTESGSKDHINNIREIIIDIQSEVKKIRTTYQKQAGKKSDKNSRTGSSSIMTQKSKESSSKTGCSSDSESRSKYKAMLDLYYNLTETLPILKKSSVHLNLSKPSKTSKKPESGLALILKTKAPTISKKYSEDKKLIMAKAPTKPCKEKTGAKKKIGADSSQISQSYTGPSFIESKTSMGKKSSTTSTTKTNKDIPLKERLGNFLKLDFEQKLDYVENILNEMHETLNWWEMDEANIEKDLLSIETELSKNPSKLAKKFESSEQSDPFGSKDEDFWGKIIFEDLNQGASPLEMDQENYDSHTTYGQLLKGLSNRLRRVLCEPK